MVLEIRKNNKGEIELFNQLYTTSIILSESEITKLKICKTMGDLVIMFSSEIYHNCEEKDKEIYKRLGYNPVSIPKSENFLIRLWETIQTSIFKRVI